MLSINSRPHAQNFKQPPCRQRRLFAATAPNPAQQPLDVA
jgi:hypothetical protein